MTVGKKFSFCAAAFILTFALAACSKVPENVDIPNIDTDISIGTPHGEVTPEAVTDRPEDTTAPAATTTADITINTTIAPETTRSEAQTELPIKADEEKSTLTEPPIKTTEETAARTEPPVTTTTPETTVQAQTTPQPEPQTTTPVQTKTPQTEPADTTVITTTEAITEAPEPTVTTEPEIPLTGGAYNQRFCTEAEAEFAERVFELTNLEREKEGLPAFEKMETLKNVALTRAWELTVEYRPDHSRPDGTICTGAFNENGIIYGGWGENIAAGQDTPEGVVEAWMNSPSHREAILNKDYTYMGVGYYYIKDDYQSYYHFWTQEFYHY